MPTEPLTGAPYPDLNHDANIAQIVQDAVTGLADATYAGPFATTTARDTAFAAWVAAGNTMRDGLHCHVTGTGDQVYLSGAWKTLPFYRTGAGTYNSNASGDIVVTHNLGQTPTACFLQSRQVGAVDTFSFGVSAMTSTTLTARVYYNGAPQPSATGIPLYWLVFP
ncbi:MAG: hypothetical protein JWO98_4746 [Frankiales bacterium]|nr:hypothetical protein [Frankiales bacterium]